MRTYRFVEAGLVVALALSFAAVGLAEEWSGWKGPNHDGQSLDTGLIPSWPDGGPKLLWRTDALGDGFSNLAFFGDKIYTEGDFDGKSSLLILDRASGKVLSQTEIGKGGNLGGYPGPKSTPATDGTMVFALNQNGFLLAADAQTGKEIWRKSFYEDFNGKMMGSARMPGMHWGYAESPLIDGDRLIVSPGGPEGTVVALDKKTGKILWRSKELTDNASYASVTPITIEGVQQYLILTHATIAGLNPANGEVLWRAEFPGQTAVCTDPIFFDGILFATCAYNVGSYAYRVTKKGGTFSVEELYDLKKIDNKHHGLVRVDRYVYTTTDRGTFACIELATGDIKWEERKIRGKAAVALADGKLILRKENTGELILLTPDPKEYTEISSFEQPDRSDRNAWTYPLVVEKKLYVRDQGTLFCYDLAK